MQTENVAATERGVQTDSVPHSTEGVQTEAVRAKTTQPVTGAPGEDGDRAQAVHAHTGCV